MPKKSIVLILTFLALSIVQSEAQKYVVFDNIPKSKRYRYQIGDEFTFRLVAQPDLTKGVITEIGKNYIVLDNLDNIMLDQISYVKVDRNGPWSGIRNVTGYVVPVAGIGYFAIESIRNASIGLEPIVRTETLTAAILSAAYGVFMQTLKRKTYRINGNHRLYIIDMGAGGGAIPFKNQ